MRRCPTNNKIITKTKKGLQNKIKTVHLQNFCDSSIQHFGLGKDFKFWQRTQNVILGENQCSVYCLKSGPHRDGDQYSLVVLCKFANIGLRSTAWS